MSRVPIRVRLAAGLAVAMCVVLALAGVFVYLRLESELNEAIDAGLRSRADDVAALVHQPGAGLGAPGPGLLTESEESFAEVLRADGSVLDSTRRASRPALDPAEVRNLQSSRIFGERRVSGIEGDARLLARRVTGQGTGRVVVVGRAIEERDDALNGLVTAFIVGGPFAVLLVVGAGYLLASVGLSPVEAMRRRAERVTLSRSGERLPLPDAKDEIRRLGETLNAMLARLEESFERERAFVADASHELRTPLTVLKAELEVTLRGGGYDEQVGASLATAVDEVDQLGRLAEDLLLIARSQDGELSVKLERTDVRELLAGVVERYRPRAMLEGRSIELEVPAGLEAQIDPLRVRQAVGNLIDNALRHGEGALFVSARRDAGDLTLSVADAGPGFPADFVDQAFLRFTRADPSRQRRGAGLGLAIVRAIAHAHGGEATIELADQGPSVVLRLPRSPR